MFRLHGNGNISHVFTHEREIIQIETNYKIDQSIYSISKMMPNTAK